MIPQIISVPSIKTNPHKLTAKTSFHKTQLVSFIHSKKKTEETHNNNPSKEKSRLMILSINLSKLTSLMQVKIEILLMTKILTFGKLQLIDKSRTKETVKCKGKARIWINLRHKEKKCKIHSKVFSFKKEIILLIPSKMTTKAKYLKKTNHRFSIFK